MSNTEDRYKEHEARHNGRVVGMYGEPKHLNPHEIGTGPWLAWNAAWEDGHKRHLKMKTRVVKAI